VKSGEKSTYFNARAMMDVGSSVRTTMEASLKICSGSAMRSSTSFSDLNLDCGACPGQKPVNARKMEFLSLVPVSVSAGMYEVCGREEGGNGLVNTVGDVEGKGSSDSAASLTVRSGVVTEVPVVFRIIPDEGGASPASTSTGLSVTGAASGSVSGLEIVLFIESCFFGAVTEASSSPSPSSSASLDSDEDSDSSSLTASLTLSRISTFARAEATGLGFLPPRMTAYLLVARSLSLVIRSKCFAIFDTLLPGAG